MHSSINSEGNLVSKAERYLLIDRHYQQVDYGTIETVSTNKIRIEEFKVKIKKNK